MSIRDSKHESHVPAISEDVMLNLLLFCTDTGPLFTMRYHQISLNLEAATYGLRIFRSLYNSTGVSVTVLTRRLSNFRTIRQFQHIISWLRYFMRSDDKTPYRLVNRGPELTVKSAIFIHKLTHKMASTNTI